MQKEFSILIETNVNPITEILYNNILAAFNQNADLVEFFKPKFATRIINNVSSTRRVVNNFLNPNMQSLEVFLTEIPPMHILEKLKIIFASIPEIIAIKIVTLTHKTKIEIESI